MTISKKPIILNLSAALFDVDGTIVDSTGPIGDFWRAFAKDKPYFDPEYVIDISHGWRTFDVIAKFAPDFAKPDYVTQLEGSVPDLYGSTAKEIPGSIKLVSDLLKLEREYSLNNQRIAIATSGTYLMATKWFKILGLEVPKVFITAESVQKGKPDPEPYLLGRSSLGYEKKGTVVVFEDAQAGIEAGLAADCLVIGIASTYNKDEVKSFGADIVVPSLEGIHVDGYDKESDTFRLVINDYSFANERVFQLQT
ncbi:hypothetical protein WICMUC_004960 [Wickerhamomyces mucosus]|uniref:Uncharacterized protein n=1 Tax=Wickerhamomyces mucosus TaxID=1378264 RepID=A0A9P8PC52_9ASCO|nr:hypothetical protein WICMUC_004960 [Wickerhamomyces mucosus]